MLRVPMAGADFSQRLLVWAEDGQNGGVVQNLRDAVLAVVEWQDGMDGQSEDAFETKSNIVAGDGLAEDDVKERAQSGPVREQKKKDSVVTSHTASESSKGERLNLGDLSAVGGNDMRGRDTCCF